MKSLLNRQSPGESRGNREEENVKIFEKEEETGIKIRAALSRGEIYLPVLFLRLLCHFNSLSLVSRMKTRDCASGEVIFFDQLRKSVLFSTYPRYPNDYADDCASLILFIYSLNVTS